MSNKHILLAGNPNVGKSTVFNALTGLNQHTGNWVGKTVEPAFGSFRIKDTTYDIYDLPGTYSVISNSPEEKVARDEICFSNPDLTVIVVDATCLTRNLNLVLQIAEITDRLLLCLNFSDEAYKKGILIDTEKLSELLGLPVVDICAKNKKDIILLKSEIAEKVDSSFKPRYRIKYPDIFEDAIRPIYEFIKKASPDTPSRLCRFIAVKLLDYPEFGAELASRVLPDKWISDVFTNLIDSVKSDLNEKGFSAVSVRDAVTDASFSSAVEIAKKCTSYSENHKTANVCLADKLLTSKITGIPMMLVFLCGILWLTLIGANYPSVILSTLFTRLGKILTQLCVSAGFPYSLTSLLIDGIYKTTAQVTAVMLPPMAIFFPLFTLLEDLGILPRIAFNLDRGFCRAGSCGKQALTMCMGLGCNAVGVSGCRIISSPAKRNAAILTNTFIPCNGRFGMLTVLSSIFIGGCFSDTYSSLVSAIWICVLIICGILVSLLVTRIMTKFVYKNNRETFTLELPPYRRPSIAKTLIRSLYDRTLHTLRRAISVAAPCGALIWLLANISFNGTTLLNICTDFLAPAGILLGLDGAILTAFLLALPANEIVLPIILMCYVSSTQPIDGYSTYAITEILKQNGWTVMTAINVMLFSVLHFPCATTLKTVKTETGSFKATVAAFFVPLFCGSIICISTNLLYHLVQLILVLI